MQTGSRPFLIFLLIPCALRLIHLEADPSVFKSTYDLGDEVWWAINAKHMLHHGTWFPGAYAGGISVAPLYSLILFCFFKWGGLSLFTLRLLPVLASTGTAILLYLYLRKYNESHARMASLMLAIAHTAFMYARIGHLESLIGFFAMASVYFMAGPRPWHGLATGISLACAILVKFSALAFLPVAAIWLAWLVYTNKRTVRFAFMAATGLLVPMALWYLAWHLPNQDKMTLYFDYLDRVVYAARPGWQVVVERLAFIAQKEFFLEPSNALLLGLAAVGLAAPPKSTRPDSYEPYQLSAIWLFLYAAILVVTDFNNRRFGLLMIPMCILGAQAFAFDRGKPARLPVLFVLVLVFFMCLPLLSLHLNLSLPEILYPEHPDRESASRMTLLWLTLAYTVMFWITSTACRKFLLRISVSSMLKTGAAAFLSVTLIQAIVALKDLGFLPSSRLIMLSLALPVLALIFMAVIWGKRPAIRVLFTLYLLVSSGLIVFDLIQPRYGVRESMRFVGDRGLSGYVISPPAFFPLCLESDLTPLYYTVDNLPDTTVLARHARMRPAYYASGYVYPDSSHFIAERNMVRSHIRGKMSLLKTFEWYDNRQEPTHVYMYEFHYGDESR